jgi:hypothetical protein
MTTTPNSKTLSERCVEVDCLLERLCNTINNNAGEIKKYIDLLCYVVSE